MREPLIRGDDFRCAVRRSVTDCHWYLPSSFEKYAAVWVIGYLLSNAKLTHSEIFHCGVGLDFARGLVGSEGAGTARFVGADCGRWVWQVGRCRSVGGRFQRRWVPRVGVDSGGGLCEGGSESLPSLGDGGGPPPGGVDPKSDLSGAPGDAGCDVQHPVAEGFDLTRGQVAVFGEADQFGPGHQICCREDDFKPCGVGVCLTAIGLTCMCPSSVAQRKKFISAESSRSHLAPPIRRGLRSAKRRQSS